MIWILANTGLAKLLSLVSQWLLGWLLTQSDFGLYALALSGAAVVNLLRNGGTQQILIQRGPEFAVLVPVVFRVALGFNLLACVVLLLGPGLAALYHSPDLTWMLACIGPSIPLATPWLIFNAKLSIERRFLALSTIGLLTQFLRQLAAVGLALCGLGAASLVLPVILESLVLSVLGRSCAGAPPKPPQHTPAPSFREIFASSRWIMLGALALAATAQGAYLVIGLFKDPATLGVYFFALQLVVSVATIFMGFIEGLVFPILAALNGERQRAVYLKAVRDIWFLALPGAILAAILSEPLIHTVWGGKWDAAIPVAQILALSMPAWLLTSLSRSVIEAQGLWRLRLALLGLYGAGEMLVAGLAAQGESLVELALWIAGYRAVFGLGQVLVASRLVGATLRPTLWAMLPPAVIALTAAGIAGYYPAGLPELPRFLVEATAFAAVFVVLSLIFLRGVWVECLGLLFRGIAKPP